MLLIKLADNSYKAVTGYSQDTEQDYQQVIQV